MHKSAIEFKKQF